MVKDKDIRILYIEDVPADVVMVNHELRKAGLTFRSKRVDTREDFLRELSEEPPDIILSDHGLPSFDGLTALAIAQSRCPDIPFIFVTSSLGEQTAIDAFEGGATDYVLKGSLSKLVPAMRRALRESAERIRLKQHETELRESEERYRQLVELCPDALFVQSNGRLAFVNSAAARLFGVESREQLLDKPLKLVIHSESWTTIRKRINRLKDSACRAWRSASGGSSRGAPAREVAVPFIREKLVRLDGTVLDVELAAAPLTFSGRPSVQFIARDITERERAMAHARRIEALKSAILDTALDAIVSIDHNGMVQEWNPAAEKIFGYRRKEALGRSLDDLIIPTGMREVYRDGLTHYLLTGAGSLVGRPIELVLQRSGGGEFLADLAISRVPTEDPPRCTALVRDITERKRAEAALRESEERLRLLIEGVRDYAIYMLDPKGNVATWNAGAERVKGHKAAEIIGQPYATFFTPEDVRRGLPGEVLKRAKAKGQDRYEGYRVRRDGSRFWAQGTVTALRDGAGRLYGFSNVAQDMTESKRAEEEIRRLNERLEERVRERTAQLEDANRELEAFSYSVSHDLRSPLRHIAGYVEMLQSEAADQLDESSRRHLQTVADSATRLGRLIDALLAFSRMSRSELHEQRISLNTLVEEARQELREDLKGRDIVWVIGELPEVVGDSFMLRQAIVNLLSNAIKYTRNRPKATIQIGALESNQEHLCFVRDNGVGFNPDYVGKLFGVFQRLHAASEFEGTGIGLANVRRIIQRHGGRTWAEGSLGQGATFFFSLPKSSQGNS